VSAELRAQLIELLTWLRRNQDLLTAEVDARAVRGDLDIVATEDEHHALGMLRWGEAEFAEAERAAGVHWDGKRYVDLEV
jgi:hypothetical protein